MRSSNLNNSMEPQTQMNRGIIHNIAISIVTAAGLVFAFSLLELIGTMNTPLIRGGGGFGWPWKFISLGIPFMIEGRFRPLLLLYDWIIPFFILLIASFFIRGGGSRARFGIPIGVLLVTFVCVESVEFQRDMKVIAANRAHDEALCDMDGNGKCDPADWDLLVVEFQNAPPCREQSIEFVAKLDVFKDGCVNAADAFSFKRLATGRVSGDEIAAIYKRPLVQPPIRPGPE